MVMDHAAFELAQRDLDDVIYCAAMLLFATLPIIAMRQESPRQPHGDAGKRVAAGAFVLLMWLQLRKQYVYGIVLVALNLGLRLWELFPELWAWSTQARPAWRESRREAAVLFCVFSVAGSSSVATARALLSAAGLHGSLLLVLATSVVYPVVLLAAGTVAGRHAFFRERLFGSRGRRRRTESNV
jgi:hypothetical protein